MMRSASSWFRGERLRAVDCARALADWETDWMTACAPSKPRLRSCRAASRRWQGFGIIDLALHDVDEETDY